MHIGKTLRAKACPEIRESYYARADAAAERATGTAGERSAKAEINGDLSRRPLSVDSVGVTAPIMHSGTSGSRGRENTMLPIVRDPRTNLRTRILLLTVDNGPTRKQRAGERTPAGRRARWTEDVRAA